MDKSYKAYLAECLQLLKDSNENTRNVTALTWQQVISRSRRTWGRGEYFRDQLDAMQRFINAAR